MPTPPYSCLFPNQSDVGPAVIKQVNFRKGSTVYSLDLPAEGVFVIQKGSVSLTFVDKVGNSRIVQVLAPGRVLGLDALLAERTRVFSAQCREDSTLCFIPTDAFERFLRVNILCSWKLLLVIDEEAHAMAIEKLNLSGQSVRRRIKFAMEQLATFGHRGKRGSCMKNQAMGNCAICRYFM